MFSTIHPAEVGVVAEQQRQVVLVQRGGGQGAAQEGDQVHHAAARAHAGQTQQLATCGVVRSVISTGTRNINEI